MRPGTEVFVVHGELHANRRFFSNDPGIVARREAVSVSCLDGHFGSVIRYNVNLTLDQHPDMPRLAAFGANVGLNTLRSFPPRLHIRFSECDATEINRCGMRLIRRHRTIWTRPGFCFY